MQAEDRKARIASPAAAYPVATARVVDALVVAGAAACVLWLAFATFVVPPIIESAYRGESLAFLNDMIHGQSVNPVAYYIGKWHWVEARVFATLLVFCGLVFVTTREKFFSRNVEAVTPGTLGAIRMWTCGILLATTLWDDISSIALLPAESRTDMGLMWLLHRLPIGFDALLANQSGLGWFQRGTEALLLLGVLGWGTRLVVPLCALSAFVLNGILREYSFFWHQNLVPIYVLMVLSFTPCGDGWSIDRLRRIYRGESVPDADTPSPLYGWARYACWVPIALTYASAGLSKLRLGGLDWISARNMRGMLYEQTLFQRATNPSISLHLAGAPDFVFTLAAAAAVLSELLFITVLFSRVGRRIMPALTIFMHIGIVFLQNIVFFDLMLLLLIFYDFDWLRRRVGLRWRSRAPMRVLYDGLCPLCARTIRVVRSMDLFGRVEVEDFRRLGPEELSAKANGVAAAALEHEMLVTVGRRSYSGFEAYRALAVALPALWPLAPWLFIPGVPALGRIVYRYVARRRFALAACNEACATDAAPAIAPAPKPAARAPIVIGYAVAIAVTVALQAFVWLNRIEFYPFTSVQMFGGRPGTVVTYYKVVGHWRSGRASQLNIEDTIAFLSINSRYEPLYDWCFGNDEQLVVCRKLLSILGTAYNQKTAAADPLAGIEIQRWKWDYGAKPRDPHFGDLDARFVGDVPKPSITGAAVRQVGDLR